MYLNSDVKKKLFKKHGGAEKNTGSSEGQIALFSHRIEYLTSHLQKNPKDNSTKRSLINMVGKRRSLLDYMKGKDITKYRALLKELDIRK